MRGLLYGLTKAELEALKQHHQLLSGIILSEKQRQRYRQSDLNSYQPACLELSHVEYSRCDRCMARKFDHQKWTEAREAFKPGKVSVLLVSEAPANRNERGEYPYFYFTDQRPTASSLYMNTMRAVFREGQDYSDKGFWLGKFQKHGYYLLGAAMCPVDKMGIKDKERNETVRSCAETNLLPEVKQLSPTAILLIKKNVFEIVRPILARSGFNVLNDEVVPFPGSGQQREFRRRAGKLLASVGR